MTFLRYLIADYERRNFSVSQCSWDPGAQEDIIAIKSPTNAEAVGKPITNINATALSPGRISGIVVGSIIGLLIIGVLAFIGKRKLTTKLGTEWHGKPELAADDAPFRPGNESSNVKLPELDGNSNTRQETDNSICQGVELEASGDIQEMKSNEEVGHELAMPNLQVSELPS